MYEDEFLLYCFKQGMTYENAKKCFDKNAVDGMWEQLKRITKKNGAIVLFGSQPFTSALVMSTLKMFKYEWVWNKKKGGNPLLSRIQPIKITENIVVFSGGKTNYYPQMTPRDKPKMRGRNRGTVSEITNNAFTENKEYTEYYPKNIIKVSNANQRGKLHPTQKPVALMEYLIKTYTNEGETVLDFTMGSGTTIVAAARLGRNAIGIELDETYYKIAVDRVNKEVAQQNLFGAIDNSPTIKYNRNI